MPLTPFEAECADLDARDYNPRQIAALLETGEGAVRQALKSAALKRDAPSMVQEWREDRDIAAAARNWRALEEPVVEVTAGEVKEGLRERWGAWPFRDHARQMG